MINKKQELDTPELNKLEEVVGMYDFLINKEAVCFNQVELNRAWFLIKALMKILRNQNKLIC